MVTMSQPRTIHPVMPPVNRSFTERHYSVFGDGPATVQRSPRGLAFTGGIATVLRGLSTFTRLVTLTVLGFVLLLIPGVAGGVAYHVASNNTAVTVIRTQEVPGHDIEYRKAQPPVDPSNMVRSAEH